MISSWVELHDIPARQRTHMHRLGTKPAIFTLRDLQSTRQTDLASVKGNPIRAGRRVTVLVAMRRNRRTAEGQRVKGLQTGRHDALLEKESKSTLFRCQGLSRDSRSF
mmetsp:Transcript_10577/g.16925  ORF Transcript_10577/g.16925 Transcript_10577/m.16925 type:complete len:108 (+) Transcript_10577:193-516(+)